MKSIRKSRPSPAMIVAIVALIVALGGTAIAANTIRSSDIVDGQVMTPDLHNGAVTPAKVEKVPAIDAFVASDLTVHANAQPTLVPLDGESFDTAESHGTGGVFVRTVVPGVYRVTGHVSWFGSGPMFLPSGTTCTVNLVRGTISDLDTLATTRADCSSARSTEVNRAVFLAKGQALGLLITQSSGADFTLDGAAHPVYLDSTWVGNGP
jgi:hypothetical protein